jgi:hypothetical protein
MYCGEKCRDSDWSSAHKGKCNEQKSYPSTTRPFKLDEYAIPSVEAHVIALQTLTARLINVIGLDCIKKTVLLENKPMKSFEDPRTKGFQDGKFQAVNLEALLSLEDNFDKLNSDDINGSCQVNAH